MALVAENELASFDDYEVELKQIHREEHELLFIEIPVVPPGLPYSSPEVTQKS